MPALRNIRQQGDRMLADFTARDGRQGAASCSVAEYAQHGDALMQQEAEAIERAARLHGHTAPEEDRFNEIR